MPEKKQKPYFHKKKKVDTTCPLRIGNAFVEFCSNCWISLSCHMNLSKLINVFLQVVTWISLRGNMDLPMLLNGFV